MNSTEKQSKVIGILALQGDYDAHRKMVEQRVGAPTALVRTPADLTGVQALILPGGESTTIAKLMQRVGLDTAVRTRAEAGMPVYGTCAGLILLARGIEDYPDQPSLGLMDVRVARNAFGQQRDSFEADIPFGEAGETGETQIRGVFIRAPYVTDAEPDVQILCRFQDKIVGVRQGNLLGTAFHPELTDDPRVHIYFAQMVKASQEKR